MLLGVIADDFTGASDIANTLAKGGLSTTQFVGVPRSGESACEAGVVALKTRSILANDAVRQSLAACDWLLAQGARQIVFKYCSTFDSTPEGNIGPVAEALLDRLNGPVAVVCPVFPATGRTLYNGHLFVGDRLLSESGLEKHPLNPMTDPDIRRWLRRQTTGEVGHVPWRVVAAGANAIRMALDAEGRAGRRLVVVDATSDDDLLEIGAAVALDPLVTGGSGIALGLPANLRRAGHAAAGGGVFTPTRGPGVVLSGSCSTASRRQIAVHAARHPAFFVETDALMRGAITAAGMAAEVLGRIDATPAVYTTAEPAEVAAGQATHGRDRLAQTIERFFGDLATALARAGVMRIVVGGGETSGAIVEALGVEALAVGPEIDLGVPALAETAPRGLRLALKSGNFGAEDFYEKALAALGTA